MSAAKPETSLKAGFFSLSLRHFFPNIFPFRKHNLHIFASCPIDEERQVEFLSFDTEMLLKEGV